MKGTVLTSLHQLGAKITRNRTLKQNQAIIQLPKLFSKQSLQKVGSCHILTTWKQQQLGEMKSEDAPGHPDFYIAPVQNPGSPTTET